MKTKAEGKDWKSGYEELNLDPKQAHLAFTTQWLLRLIFQLVLTTYL